MFLIFFLLLKYILILFIIIFFYFLSFLTLEIIIFSLKDVEKKIFLINDVAIYFNISHEKNFLLGRTL